MRGFVRKAITKPRFFGRDATAAPLPAIFEVRSGDGIVFLDLHEDEYSCRYEPERPISSYRAQAAIEDASNRPLPAIDWLRPRSRHTASPSLRDVARFIQALLQSLFRYRKRTLRELAAIAQALPAKPDRQLIAIHEAADLFQTLLLWVPLRPKCLFASFFMLHFLALYGFRADWIFGVQLFPFRAHCWLAAEDEPLNEAPHTIEDYHIIWVADSLPR